MAQFQITEAEQALLKTLKVPAPTLEPQERLRRRLAFRNENTLYKRTCDLCSKSMISAFEQNTEFPVYCHNCWSSDRWNPLDYGVDFDFSRPFCEQFAELQKKVPKAGVLNFNTENSEFNSFTAFARNVYMSSGSYQLEDCVYVRKSQNSRDCINSNLINKCELVAYASNCEACYQSHHLKNCRSCNFSAYLVDCLACQNCFMSVGLTQAKYHFKNKAYSQEEYEQILASYAQKSEDEIQREFEEFLAQNPRNKDTQINCENCSGSYLQNCKNTHFSQDCFDTQDSFHLLECTDVKDSMDLTFHDKEIQFCYEICSGGDRNYETHFSYCPVNTSYCDYTYACFYASSCFGCDSLNKRVEYCIFNKQYSKEEYETLRAQIIEHMKKTGEYGEFFPIEKSLFAYNETVAQDFFPLSKEEALAKGYRWKEIHNEAAYLPSQDSAILNCKDCRKQYKIIPKEAELSQKIGIAPATQCWSCRRKKLHSKSLS